MANKWDAFLFLLSHNVPLIIFLNFNYIKYIIEFLVRFLNLLAL